MTRILFICHGNICRSPMAEYTMKDFVRRAGKEGRFTIASSAATREEIGNPVYPRRGAKLAEHGISCEGHAARLLTGGIMRTMTSSSVWTRRTSGTCGGSAAVIRRGSSTC